MSEVIIKTCKDCKVEKTFSEFGKLSANKDGLNNSCKQCQREYTNAWNRANPEKAAAKAKKHRLLHIDKHLAREAAYRDANREMLNARQREIGMATRPLLRAKKRIKNAEEPWINRELHAHKRARGGVAPWSSRDARLEIYKVAHEMTVATGIPHEVNHIVPLQSKHVSGLHCEANLEVLTMSDNRKLKNGTWPDMPDGIKRKRKS